MFGKHQPNTSEHLESDAQGLAKSVVQREQVLQQLLASLSTNLLDNLVVCGAPNRAKLIHILEEQIRHIISVARAVGYAELIASSEREEKVLEELRDLFVTYHGAGVESPDVQSTINRLRETMENQQRMLLGHSQILQEERERLAQILGQVEGLKQDEYRDTHFSFPAQDKGTQYL